MNIKLGGGKRIKTQFISYLRITIALSDIFLKKAPIGRISVGPKKLYFDIADFNIFGEKLFAENHYVSKNC